nr:hypothetical protein BaRGS_021644 [Batillaria attramentaria]
MFEAENDFGFVPGFEEFPFDGGVPSSLDQLVDWLDIEGGEARDGTSAPHDIQHFREAGDSAELTSNLTAVQPALTKATGHDFSVENFDPDLDLLGDLHGFGDPLGDASMDSFTDLTALLGGTTSAPLKDKYRNRREKNNIASKRSRDTRKRKFADMEAEADRLQTENARLETRIVELERLAKQMKEILVAKMAGKA